MLKALAALEGKTIKQCALERLFPGDPGALEALKALLSERLAEARRGEVVEGGVSELAEQFLREKSRE